MKNIVRSSFLVALLLLVGAGRSSAMEKADPNKDDDDPFHCKDSPENCLPGDPPDLPGGGATPGEPAGLPQQDPPEGPACTTISQRIAVLHARKAADERVRRDFDARNQPFTDAVNAATRDETAAKTAMDDAIRQVASLKAQLARFLIAPEPGVSPIGKPLPPPKNPTYDTSTPQAQHLFAGLRAAMQRLAVASGRWRAAHALTVSAQAQLATLASANRRAIADLATIAAQIANLERADCTSVNERKLAPRR